GEISEIVGCVSNGKDVALDNEYGFAGRTGAPGQSYTYEDTPLWYDSGGSHYSWILYGRRAGGPSKYYFPELAFACINSSDDSDFQESFPNNNLSEDIYANDVRFTVKGLKVQEYDSAGDPSVFQWSNNPAWCILDFLEKRAMQSLDSSLISYISFYNAAQVCIANKYEVSLAVSEQKKDIETLDDLLTACRGYLTYTSGRVELNVEALWIGEATHSFDDASSGKTEDNIAEDSFEYSKEDMNDVPNRVIVAYVDREIRSNMALINGYLDKNDAVIPYGDLQGIFDDSGSVYISGEETTYTSKTSSQLEGCAARTKDYPSGYPVFQGAQTSPEMTAIWNDYDSQDRVKRSIEKEI
ncbi:hypothetical protein KAR91_15915, partial [Candidatus Pacearchaeota archaeon]|nr:hypothetical protein [Candidatus Pacearchaeota archaeon]